MQSNKISNTFEYLGNFDLEKYIFMTLSEISFEKLYEEKKNQMESRGDNLIIEYEGHVYVFCNPHTIHFTFPDGKQKDIYVANIVQFMYIDRTFGKNFRMKIVDSSSGGTEYGDINTFFDSKNIKYVNPLIDESEFNSGKFIKEKITDLSEISLNYKHYLEHSDEIQNQKNNFILTDERSKFFEFLQNTLKKQTIVAICGLEGIGKTATILAYLKCYKMNYYYFNIKTIDKLLKKNEKNTVLKIIVKELYSCITKFNEVEKYYDSMKNIIENNNSAIDILKDIISIIKGSVAVLVIDQYKTKYDENYNKLKNIFSLYPLSKKIIISSMNEDDIRDSIIISIKKALNINQNIPDPILNYYYIIKLVNVSKEELEELSEIQRNLLSEFGNLYIYYYKIKNLKYRNYVQKFKSEMESEISTKVNEYYKNRKSHELLNIYKYLIFQDNEKIDLNECIKIIDQIPLRYFYIKYQDKNIINFSDLKSNEKVAFQSAYDYIREFFILSYNKIFIETNKDINYKSNKFESNKAIQDSVNLENLVGYYIWGFRNKIKINNIKITTYIKINSIFDIKENYFDSFKTKIQSLNKKESILIFQEDENAKLYDLGILEKVQDNKFNFYFIQITNKKEADARATLTGINDNINYVNGKFSLKLKIEFNNNYFFYIFNKSDPDTSSIAYCEKNNIDYLLFDLENLILEEKSSLQPVHYYIPVYKYLGDVKNEDRMVDIEKIKFTKKDLTDKNIEKTYAFLKRKRELTSKNNKEIISEVEKLKEYEKKFVIKKANINYGKKEFLINNYLLSNEYKNQKIFGISYQKKVNNEIQLDDKQKKRLYQLCGKNLDRDIIFSVEKIKIYNWNYIKPEFDCYIIFHSNNNNTYYFDFLNKKYYNLNNDIEEDYEGKNLFGFGDFYCILFLDKNINISE